MESSPSPSWIDVPIAADDPARAALFRTFLVQHEFRFEEHPMGIRIVRGEARAVAQAIAPWSNPSDMPEDPRSFDSLDRTMRSVYGTVLSAIEDSGVDVVGPDRAASGTGTAHRDDTEGIDLR